MPTLSVPMPGWRSHPLSRLVDKSLLIRRGALIDRAERTFRVSTGFCKRELSSAHPSSHSSIPSKRTSRGINRFTGVQLEPSANWPPAIAKARLPYRSRLRHEPLHIFQVAISASWTCKSFNVIMGEAALNELQQRMMQQSSLLKSARHFPLMSMEPVLRPVQGWRSHTEVVDTVFEYESYQTCCSAMR